MKLIPFHHTYADQVMTWQLDKDYARFFRGQGRHLNLEELQVLPQYFGETFMVMEKGNIIGMCCHKMAFTDISNIGVLIDKNYQRKGRCVWIVKLLEDYLFNVRGIRKIMVNVETKHGLSRCIEEDLGYKLAGCLKQHTYVNGIYEDIFIYEKMR